MPSKQYLNTSRTLLRVARNMTDQMIASRLRPLRKDYNRRAQKASDSVSARVLARAAVRRGSAGRIPK
jgi:hypothetical protein